MPTFALTEQQIVHVNIRYIDTMGANNSSISELILLVLSKGAWTPYDTTILLLRCCVSCFPFPQEIINDEIRVTVPPLEGKLEDLLRKPWPPGVRMLGEGRFFFRGKFHRPFGGIGFRATLEKPP